MSALEARPHVIARRQEPWLGWLAVCVCRGRVRQRWLFEVTRERLSDVHDDVGEVPGLAGWRYSFHGSASA